MELFEKSEEKEEQVAAILYLKSEKEAAEEKCKELECKCNELLKKNKNIEIELQDYKDQRNELQVLHQSKQEEIEKIRESVKKKDEEISFLKGQIEAYQYCMNCRR